MSTDRIDCFMYKKYWYRWNYNNMKFQCRFFFAKLCNDRPQRAGSWTKLPICSLMTRQRVASADALRPVRLNAVSTSNLLTKNVSIHFNVYFVYDRCGVFWTHIRRQFVGQMRISLIWCGYYDSFSIIHFSTEFRRFWPYIYQGG